MLCTGNQLNVAAHSEARYDSQVNREWCAVSHDANVWRCAMPSEKELAPLLGEQVWEFCKRVYSKAGLVRRKKFPHCNEIGVFSGVSKRCCLLLSDQVVSCRRIP